MPETAAARRGLSGDDDDMDVDLQGRRHRRHRRQAPLLRPLRRPRGRGEGQTAGAHTDTAPPGGTLFNLQGPLPGRQGLVLQEGSRQEGAGDRHSVGRHLPSRPRDQSAELLAQAGMEEGGHLDINS